MQISIMIFHVLYVIVNAPCADDATTPKAEDKNGKSPAMEYG